MARPDPSMVTSRTYHQPYRPAAVRLLNGAGRLGTGLGMDIPLDSTSLLRAARKKTGLTHFGSEDFLVPLEKLIWSLEHEAGLTTMGRLIQRSRLVGALATRLRVEERIRRQPDILEQDCLPMIVVTGLQRTGTTMLHRLLAADPDCRSLASWEALNPVSFPDDHQDRRRIRAAQLAEKGLSWLSPEFFAVHPVESLAPEEEVLLLDLSFMSTVPEATLNVPTYAAWLRDQDYTPAYEYLRRLLLILQAQACGRFWVLKTPHHLECLDKLVKVFPEAAIIQTHRDPQKTTGSFCSMVAHGRGLCSDAVDPRLIGKQWLAKLREMVLAAMRFRDEHGSGDRILDISYYDLMDDPAAVIRRIYDHAGIPLEEAAVQAMEATRRKETRHRYGRHVYDIRDFGLSRETIDAAFSEYRERYQVPYEDRL